MIDPRRDADAHELRRLDRVGRDDVRQERRGVRNPLSRNVAEAGKFGVSCP
jgi:hypothetical protein